jgi:hypothetical protein
MSNINQKKEKTLAHPWANGFMLKGRKVFHPYTQIDFNKNNENNISNKERNN